MHRSILHFALIISFGLGSLLACSNGANPVTEGSPGSGAASEGVGDKVSSVDTLATKTAEKKTLDERISAYLEIARVDNQAELSAKIKETFLSASYSSQTFSPQLAATLLQHDANLTVTGRFVAQSAKVLNFFAPFYAWQGVVLDDGNAFSLSSVFSADASGDPAEATAIEHTVDVIEKGIEYTFQVITAYGITYNTYVIAVLSTFWDQIEIVGPSDIEMAKFAPGIDFSRIENKNIESTFRRLASASSFRADGKTFNYFTWRPTAIENSGLSRDIRSEGDADSIENVDKFSRDKLSTNRSSIEIIESSNNVFIESGFVMTTSIIERFRKFISASSGTRDFLNFSAVFTGARLDGNRNASGSIEIEEAELERKKQLDTNDSEDQKLLQLLR